MAAGARSLPAPFPVSRRRPSQLLRLSLLRQWPPAVAFRLFCAKSLRNCLFVRPYSVDNGCGRAGKINPAGWGGGSRWRGQASVKGCFLVIGSRLPVCLWEQACRRASTPKQLAYLSVRVRWKKQAGGWMCENDAREQFYQKNLPCVLGLCI